LIWLDGKRVYAPSRANFTPERVVFAGALPPGEHVMHVNASFSGRYSARGFLAECKSMHRFDVAAGTEGPDRVTAVLHESAKPNTPVEVRLRLRYVDNTAADRAKSIVIKIWVSTTGDIELNGQPADLETVEKAITDVAASGGTALYAVNPDESDTHPHAVSIMAMFFRTHIRVRLSTKRDFSDVAVEARP
jgi:biopolymer transport protein ExbD